MLRLRSGVATSLGLVLLLTAAYVLLGRLAFSFAVQHGNVTSVVFAPEGVALAFAIRFGVRVVPGILLGQTVLSIWSGPSVLGGLAIGTVNSLEAALGAWLFHRLAIRPGLNRPRDAGLLIGMIFLLLQPISATGGVTVLYLLGVIPLDWIPADWAPWWIRGIQAPLPSLDLIPSAWLHWWIGNSMGQLLVAPLLLAWLSPEVPRTPGRYIDLLFSAFGIGLVVLLTLGDLPIHPLVLLAVTYPLLVWIGIQRGVRGVVVANALIVPAVISAGANGEGMLSGLSASDRIAYVSFFIASGCMLSLMVSALFEERRQLIEDLIRLASTDALTGLGNRRHFLEFAEKELAKARRHGRPLSLLLLDIDHFKRVNDELGHVAGDEVIRAVADCCAATARKSDLVGRLGGEEFALVLPETPLKGAGELAERLRERVAATKLLIDGQPRSVTVSIGVALFSDDSRIGELLGRADDAMYAAKREGRNRVVLAPQTMIRSAEPGPAVGP